MNAFNNFFKGLAGKASKLTGGGSLKGRRVFNAYHSGDYEAMTQLCASMSAKQFINEVKEDDINILHHCAINDNYDAMAALCALPYFSEVVNDNSNADGWTPILSASASSNATDLRLIKLMVDNGADINKSRKKDGLMTIHFAASNNDVHLVDFIL